MSLVTCPRCRGPMFDCVCPERLDANPPRLAPGDPAHAAVALLDVDLTVDETWLDEATVKVADRLRATVAASKGGR